MATKIPRFTHLSVMYMRTMLRDAGYGDPNLGEACDRVYAACTICASYGRPIQSTNISLRNVNKSFNQEMQTDFVTIYINSDKLEIINIVDLGAGYGERLITRSKDADNMKRLLETDWIY